MQLVHQKICNILCLTMVWRTAHIGRLAGYKRSKDHRKKHCKIGFQFNNYLLQH